jgi:hypothetical protein
MDDFVVTGTVIYEFMPGTTDQVKLDFDLQPDQELYERLVQIKKKELDVKKPSFLTQKRALIFAVEATGPMQEDKQFETLQSEILKFVKSNESGGGDYQLPFRLDVFTFFEGTSPHITYEKGTLFENQFRDESPRMSHLTIDIKEVDNRLKKILNSYNFKHVEEVNLVIFSGTSLTYSELQILQTSLREASIGKPVRLNLSYVKIINE